LHEHRSGIVVDNKFFICEHCHETVDEEDTPVTLSNIKTASHKEMPIALWLIQEQNKGKSFMSIKKQ